MQANETKLVVLGSGFSAMSLPNEALDLVKEVFEDNGSGSEFSVAVETASMVQFIDIMCRTTGFWFNQVSNNHDTRTVEFQQSQTQWTEPAQMDQQAAQATNAANEDAQNVGGRQVLFRDVARDGNLDPHFASPIFRGVRANERLDEEAVRRRLHRMSSTQAEMDISEVERIVSETTALTNQLVQNHRKLNRLQSAIEDNPMVAELYQQATLLRTTQNNKVEDVFFTDNHLVVRTENLLAFCDSDGSRREIGRMEFLISMEALVRESFQTNFITIRNRTREMTVNGNARQAPHVGASGYACFGNITNTIVELMARRDLVTIVDQLIRYIETPNEGDVLGAYAKYWPVAAEANGVGNGTVQQGPVTEYGNNNGGND